MHPPRSQERGERGERGLRGATTSTRRVAVIFLAGRLRARIGRAIVGVFDSEVGASTVLEHRAIADSGSTSIGAKAGRLVTVCLPFGVRTADLAWVAIKLEDVCVLGSCAKAHGVVVVGADSVPTDHAALVGHRSRRWVTAPGTGEARADLTGLPSGAGLGLDFIARTPGNDGALWVAHAWETDFGTLQLLWRCLGCSAAAVGSRCASVFFAALVLCGTIVHVHAGILAAPHCGVAFASSLQGDVATGVRLWLWFCAITAAKGTSGTSLFVHLAGLVVRGAVPSFCNWLRAGRVAVNGDTAGSTKSGLADLGVLAGRLGTGSGARVFLQRFADRAAADIKNAVLAEGFTIHGSLPASFQIAVHGRALLAFAPGRDAVAAWRGARTLFLIRSLTKVDGTTIGGSRLAVSDGGGTTG